MLIRKRKNIVVYCFTVISVVIIAIFAFLIPGENLKLGEGKIYDLNSGWKVEYAKEIIENVNLPVKIKVNSNEIYSAQYQFQENLPEAMTLRIRSSMQTIKLYLDEKVIFESEKPADGPFHSPLASVWYFVPLPLEVQGKTLTMEISTPIKGFSGTINAVHYGSSETLHLDLFVKHRVGLVSSLIVMFLGLLTIILSFFLCNMEDRRLLYLGLFAVSTGIWMFSEAKLLQFITGNRFLIGGISYMMVALMPIPLYLYIRDAVLRKHKNFLTGIAILFFLEFLANVALQVTGILAFIQSLVVTNGVILITAAIVVYFLFQEAYRDNNIQAKHFLRELIIFQILMVFEIIQFYIQNYIAISAYTRIGILVFYCFLIVDTIHYINDLIVKENEASFFRKLALKDMLTGSDNRTSFNRDLEKLLYGKEKNPFRLMLLDINNLKMINDLYGHPEGDQAIITCYQKLSEAFHNLGKSYRLGGDEFACIMENTEEAEYEKAYAVFREQLQMASQSLPYCLDVAAASGVYTHNSDFNEFYYHIDQLMYKDKENKKGTIIDNILAAE
ncbi:MAG: diguanylate cyclase [Anaerocolumna sp.]|jgi:diguanylate cyclase (GGDEF)-like protein|nr:diguanylate cyclase [Anaerocolumna sp.]